MKPFECDACGQKVHARDAVARWRFEKEKNHAGMFQIVHSGVLCNLKSKERNFNRELSLEYVFRNMPEFLEYIGRFSVNKKELKDFVQRIEKERSYIRRFNADKKEVKKLIIRMDGLDNG